ncbi:TM1812 family CRISPR-associated protein [Desulfurobacterium atlanticum]|uniref:CRISPR-associated protein, MJ1666 family n=1 Tax=Desulfurobacterium atlanticum TaxID=240169 RepID=A0A238Y4A2_9BACT|nr:hypothetical protein [Desulfurobacterium atlanticum]SNR65947.1 CRISPR-associated protein, MJ1666 family [Desulfurobacterium atlanticum]
MQGFICATLGNVKGWREVNFSYEGKNSKPSKLSTLVVSREENVKPLIFIPHSLLESGILNDIKELSNNSEIEFDFVISPSFGKYDYEYNIRFYQLVFFYFHNFTKKFLSEETENLKFFADVSVGMNQLTFAMLEAFKFFRIFVEFLNLGKRKKPKFYIVYSEPVIGSNSDKVRFNIYKETFKPKAFLSLPIKWKEIRDVESNIDKLPVSSEMKNELKKITKSALYILTSTIKNFPLVIYHLGYYPEKKIKKIMKNLISELSPIMGSSESPPKFEKNEKNKIINYLFTKEGINYRLISNTFLLFSFYGGISALLEKNGIPENGKQGEVIDDLYEKFSSIYREIFGKDSPNEILLAKDIDRLKKLTSNHKSSNSSISFNFGKDNPIIEKMWKNAQEYENEKFKTSKNPSHRNFIAHSGLLTNLLEYNPITRSIRYKNDTQTIKIIEDFIQKS